MGTSWCCANSDPLRKDKKTFDENMILANAGLPKLTKVQLTAMNGVWNAIFRRFQTLQD